MVRSQRRQDGCALRKKDGMPITYTRGNILEDNAEALVNTVNCVGVMGKGIAAQFKLKYPSMYEFYRFHCNAGFMQIGTVYTHPIGEDKPRYVINVPTKLHWYNPSEYSYITQGLEALVAEVVRLDIKSIAIPPLGCGNGRLSWALVRPMIEQACLSIPNVDVRLYEP